MLLRPKKQPAKSSSATPTTAPMTIPAIAPAERPLEEALADEVEIGLDAAGVVELECPVAVADVLAVLFGLFGCVSPVA